jgi:hypothetical protein
VVSSNVCASGEPVTIDKALQLSTVWGCVRLLSDSVSTLPLHVFRGDGLDPIPTPPLLQRPSADFPELADWLWAIMASLLLCGNAWGVVTDRAGAGLLPSHLCGHPGAGAVDHVISRKLAPWLALDPANLRPVHGSLSPCPVCGRRCNEEKGDRAGLPERPRQSRRW